MSKHLFFFAALGLIFLSACTSEANRLVVNPTSIVVYSEGTQQLTTDVANASFSSADEYYASVSSSGLVTGERVGETEIFVSASTGRTTIPITILNRYSLYPDLDYLVGKQLSDIKQLMGSDFETTTSSGETTYAYLKPTYYVDAILFIMKGSLVGSIGVLVPTANTTMLTKHLLERYMVAGMQNEYYFFLNHDKNVVVALQVYSASYLLVLYIDYTPTQAVGEIDFSHYLDVFADYSFGF